MDAASFKQQFLPCHAKLYRVAFRLMGNVQDAEDILQEMSEASAAYKKILRNGQNLKEFLRILCLLYRVSGNNLQSLHEHRVLFRSNCQCFFFAP